MFPNNYHVSVELPVRKEERKSTAMQNLCNLKYPELFVEKKFQKVWLHQTDTKKTFFFHFILLLSKENKAKLSSCTCSGRLSRD